MKRLNNIQKKKRRTFICPQCKKLRMNRDADHEVSDKRQEYKARDASTVTLFVDICDWCKQSNYRRYFEPQKSDIRRLLKTVKLSEDESLEDLL